MVYTKTGDKGTTSLVGGTRVKKCDPRVETYGTVDELNSHIGLLAEMIHEKSINAKDDDNVSETLADIHSQLKSIQNNLFVMQTLLATEDASICSKLPQLKPEAVTSMEGWIDCMEARLPKLNSFVIAGGSLAAAQAHVARTVCRRAERAMVSLCETENVEETLLKYINRTSDYLFVLSRYTLLLENKEENFWSAV